MVLNVVSSRCRRVALTRAELGSLRYSRGCCLGPKSQTEHSSSTVWTNFCHGFTCPLHDCLRDFVEGTASTGAKAEFD